jgi:hypothetical protein
MAAQATNALAIAKRDGLCYGILESQFPQFYFYPCSFDLPGVVKSYPSNLKTSPNLTCNQFHVGTGHLDEYRVDYVLEDNG